MMKRIFILLAVFLISTLSLTAEIKTLSSDSFEIKGYKITGSDDVEFVITDAISESLNTFSQADLTDDPILIKGRNIDATNHMGTFLSDTADISADNVDNIIFSYRLVSSGDEKYTITFNITPFKDENRNTIDAAFKTDHHNIVYSDGTQASDFPPIPPATAGSTANGSLSDPDDPSTNQSHKDVLLKDSIKPKEGNSSQWISRGAVLMAVSRRDFDRAPTGMYKSTVTATLTTH